ncbi:MAG: dTDP-glucose 4,6-dehydratase [Ignavibacteriae bacterium]|nr:MAG: dTDP-glucose 4,6-dehydratase [Ignavibacteriota bacterium]
MNILITGGAGFIGSSLTDKLLKQKNYIVCIDNLDDFYSPEIKLKNINSFLNDRNYVFIQGDIREENILNNIFKNYSIDVVIHLAAKAGVLPSLKTPQIYYDVNVLGTLKLLEAMKLFNVKKLIFASSSSVYGNSKKIPFSEEDNVDFPISPYGASKKACESLCYTYHYLYNFDIFCLRYFSVYGPKQRPEMVISKFARSIILNVPIPVYGNGNSRRDYTYIDDIVEGTISAIKYLKGFEIINLGESKNYDLNTVIELLEKYIDKKAIINYLPEQPGDIKTTFADISKARKLINYNPSTDLETGIKKFVEWLINNSI